MSKNKEDIENALTVIKSNANQMLQAENPVIRNMAGKILACVKHAEKQTLF